VSHDLRAPLRSIDGFSQALLEDYATVLDLRGKDYLSRVRGATQRMAELIEDLLQLSRVGRAELHREELNLSALVKSVADELARRSPERHVTMSMEPAVRVVGDSRLLRVLLENLLGNAWKFTAKTADARVEFGVECGESARVYYVRDNGAGFDMTYANKLFQPFQRLHTEREFAGTGIGLATVYRIVDRHGGRVWAEGAVGEGATIRFTLPVSGASK
jgi:light-regulated signal transduction histidine kinase (bacteriophytochrome)